MKLRLAMGQPQYDEGREPPKFIEVNITKKFITELEAYIEVAEYAKKRLAAAKASPLFELVWNPGTKAVYLYEFCSWMDEEKGRKLVKWEDTYEQDDTMSLEDPLLTLRKGEFIFQAERPTESMLLYSHAFTLDDVQKWMAAGEKLVYHPFSKEEVLC